MAASRSGLHTCSVDGCVNSAAYRRKGWCQTHYHRWYRTGDVQAGVPVAARRHGSRTCEADDCEQVLPKGRYCAKHEARMRRHGDLDMVRVPEPRSGADNPSWTGDGATYNAVHLRLTRTRGRADARQCVACGGRAAQWSYRKHEMAGARRESDQGPYSTCLDDYDPRCVPCHKAYDLGGQ